MPFQNIWLDILFVLSVIIIWFMIVYQLGLFIAGYLFSRRAGREKETGDFTAVAYPKVTILIPAHNEEKVIARTIRSMQAFNYPHDNLEILVINDASTDRTGEIIAGIAGGDPRVRMVEVPPPGGQGKSAALNFGLKHASGEIIAVYDADNAPEPDALKYLTARLVTDERCGAALGLFRPYNKMKNLLTRFVNIETLSFQWIVQAGRYSLLNISTLPGTNFVIRKKLLEGIGGWDEQALSEDAELSLRLYQHGQTIAFVPYAVTWEQEPETIKTWINQRTRWVRGNNYVLAKFFCSALTLKPKLVSVEILYNFALYYVFLSAIILSDILFILGLLQVISMLIPGPYREVWLLAYVLFIVEILLALSREDEDTPANLFLSVIMYFTYCQLWLLVVIRALYFDLIKKEKRIWHKTERFG